MRSLKFGPHRISTSLWTTNACSWCVYVLLEKNVCVLKLECTSRAFLHLERRIRGSMSELYLDPDARNAQWKQAWIIAVERQKEKKQKMALNRWFMTIGWDKKAGFAYLWRRGVYGYHLFAASQSVLATDVADSLFITNPWTHSAPSFM